MTFELISTAFKHNERIPDKFTCKGQDILPALEWNDVPVGTKSFALIMDDPDAPIEIAPPDGVWDHWGIYNIPASITKFSEGVRIFEVSSDIEVLYNSWGEKRYGGPCPPPGKLHRYCFKLYALKENLMLHENAIKEDLLVEIKKKKCFIAKAELIGLYSS